MYIKLTYKYIYTCNTLVIEIHNIAKNYTDCI